MPTSSSSSRSDGAAEPRVALGRATDPAWDALVRDHQVAVAEFATASAGIEAGEWSRPRVPGKWTPGQVAVHLLLAFDAATTELEGGRPMARRTTRWQQTLLRWTVLRRLLAGGAFPPGVRSPREARPLDAVVDQTVTISRFRDASLRFEAALATTLARNPRTRLTHPYFGGISLRQALRLSTVHVRHHRKQLPAGDRPADGGSERSYG